MKQEYLFTDSTQYEDVKKYSVDNVKSEIQKIDGTEYFIAIYSVSGENEENAKVLSRVNEYIIEKFCPTVLTNESSAYFNKILFPYVNEFERKLRKLLYLKSIVNGSEKASENIRDLEDKDLGKIFELLFTDEQFVKNVKSKVNDKTWQFTKNEVVESIQTLTEDTLWDLLMGHETIAKLRNNYIKVKGYRNNVMHAHNIGMKTFFESKKMFIEINNQLDEEIAKVITHPDKVKEETKKVRFNETLSDEIAKLQIEKEELRRAVAWADDIRGAVAMVEELKKVLQSPLLKEIKESRAVTETLKALVKAQNNK